MRQRVEELVTRYENHRNALIRSDSTFSEADTRADFIDPFFAAIGWDINNENGLSQRFREVVRETRVDVEDHTKKPDYEFRLGPERRFFVEAKRPHHKLLDDAGHAFQTRRYGWSAGLLVSVLTNFEHLVIFDTTTQPSPDHNANHSRLYAFSYNEYANKFDEICALLSRESVYSGEFDARFTAEAKQRSAESIDAVFLNTLNNWRVLLGQDLVASHPEIDSQFLNEIVQRFILRILFLRMCEDRGIQTYEHLKSVAQSNDWVAFMNLLRDSDIRFDSELFSIKNDPFFNADDQAIVLNSAIVLKIIDSLYYPQAPYTFSVIEPEFLGDIYQQFLVKRLEVDNGQPVLREKPENEDRDVIPTPRPLIERIVQETLEPLVHDASPDELLEMRIIDPACGSGGFLIAAFDVLVDRAISIYQERGEAEAIYETAGGAHLTFEKKSEILRSCLYGVDRDFLAVDVTRFSLLVKLLEDETPESLPSTNGILPALESKIVCGDSLVDDRIYDEEPGFVMVGLPLAWGEDIEDSFSFVVGNPPYQNTESMVNLEPTEYAFYRRHYKSAYRQFDKYYLFIERSLQDLLDDEGLFGMVVSRKFTHIESGKKLRGLISRDRHLVRLVDFGTAQLFKGRTTYTCLLFLSKKGVPEPENEDDDTFEYELVTTPEDWLPALVGDFSNLIKLPRKLVAGDKAWLLPSTLEELELILALNENTVPLGQIFDVFNGIQTSRNEVYVITDWKITSDKLLSFRKEEQERSIERDILKPFFDDDYGDLVSFRPMPDTARVIFPYFLEQQNDGALRASVIPSGVMKRDHPHAYAWLEHNIETLKARDIQPSLYPEDEWYRYGRDQALTLFEERQKIVVGVNSLGDKYVYDDTNQVLASGGTAGECAIAHFIKPEDRSPYDLYFILAVLNHKAVEFFCRKRGSPFRGGWFARGTAVLKDVPVPLIDFNDVAKKNERLIKYNQIVSACKKLCDIHKNLDAVESARERLRAERKSRALRRSMDELISELYNISHIIDKVELPT